MKRVNEKTIADDDALFDPIADDDALFDPIAGGNVPTVGPSLDDFIEGPPSSAPANDDTAERALFDDDGAVGAGAVTTRTQPRAKPYWAENNAPPPVLARNHLRDMIYEMTDAELEQLIADIWKLVWGVMKEIEAKDEKGRSFWVIAADELIAQFTDDEGSIDFVGAQAVAARLPAEIGGFQLRFALTHLYPKAGVDWSVHIPEVQERDDHGYLIAADQSHDELAAEHQKLVAKISAGTATPADRVGELLRRAELQTAKDLIFRQNDQRGTAAELRLRQQKVEGIVWFLDKALRPTVGFPKGKVSKPMPPHHADTVRRRGVESTQNLKPVVGLDPLLDCLSFKN
jgi:hypothetical protein